MKVKPLKIKIKEPTPSAADRLYARHQAIRKEKGVPDPSEYKKKLDAMKKEEVEQLDELSPETKASYVSKAQAQVKELKPWTKKGEYKDLAKNLIAKRQKGIAKVTEQHIEGRFKPVKPRNVRNVGTASPRQTSDSADVRLKEARMTWDDMMTKDGPAPKPSRKAEIVRSAAKKKSNTEDQFQANPILDSDVNPQTNKQ